MATSKFIMGSGLGGIGTSNVALKAVANFESGGGVVTDCILENTHSPCYVQEFYMANGDNTFNVPNPSSLNNCGGLVIVPPPTNNAIAYKIKGVGGDTGVNLSKFAPSLVAFDTPPPASVIINWAGRNYQNQTVTLDGTNNRVNLTAHGLIKNEVFRFVAAGTLPTELLLNVDYYVMDVINADNFQFTSVKDGAIIDFTGNGTGTIKLSTSNLFKMFWF